MKKLLFKTIGIIEMLIGISTLIGCFISQTYSISGISPKQINVYIFVLCSATMSFILGLGIFSAREWARKLLIFFSGYILITKILIYLGLLTFNNVIVQIIPIEYKDLMSFLYHSFLIIALVRYDKKS